MKLLKDTALVVIIEIIIFSVPSSIAYNKDLDMLFIILITIAIIFILSTIVLLWLLEKLQKFNRALMMTLFSQMFINEEIFGENPQLREAYLRAVRAVGRLNPTTEEDFNDLFIFDKKNPHRQRIIDMRNAEQE